MNTDVYEAILHCITGLTVISQLYIFYLINWESVKTMSNYKFFLNYFTFFDLLFTIIFGTLLQPNPTGRLLSVTTGGLISNLNPQIQMATASFAVYSGASMLLSQNWCLLYRWAAIRENRNLHHFCTSTKGKVLLMLLGQLISVPIGICMYKMFVQPEKLSSLPEFLQYLRPDQFAVWVDLNSPITKSFTVTALILLVISESACCFIIYSILATLRKNSAKFSKNSSKLHKQLTLLLAIQLATPLLFVVVPVSTRLFNAVAGNGSVSTKVTPDITRIGFIFLTFYGLSNAILTVIFVVPFRHHFINTFIIVWLRPIFSLIGLNHLAPRRKSVVWTSSTQHQQTRRLTIVNSTIFDNK